ncbi:MAG: hypothetical protein IKS49_04490 [Actinomycetaceae bacterium]|nr:hypothetical protein [Actinomycetaceae bacterium]
MNRKTIMQELVWASTAAVGVFVAHFLAVEAGFSPEMTLVVTLWATVPFLIQLLIVGGVLFLGAIAGLGWLSCKLDDWLDERISACELKEQL